MTTTATKDWHAVLLHSDLTFELPQAIRDHGEELRAAYATLESDGQRATAVNRLCCVLGGDQELQNFLAQKP